MRKIDTDKLYKYIGNNIRDYRKLKCMTTKTLAEKTNMADGTIRNIESGAPASLPTLLSISNELNIPFDALIQDYTIHTSCSEISPLELEIFIDTYSLCSNQERKFIMEFIKLYRLHRADDSIDKN